VSWEAWDHAAFHVLEAHEGPIPEHIFHALDAAIAVRDAVGGKWRDLTEAGKGNARRDHNHLIMTMKLPVLRYVWFPDAPSWPTTALPPLTTDGQGTDPPVQLCIRCATKTASFETFTTKRWTLNGQNTLRVDFGTCKPFFRLVQRLTLTDTPVRLTVKLNEQERKFDLQPAHIQLVSADMSYEWSWY
jgi:hypothetical protein